jgi:hypothetical protein
MENRDEMIISNGKANLFGIASGLVFLGSLFYFSGKYYIDHKTKEGYHVQMQESRVLEGDKRVTWTTEVSRDGVTCIFERNVGNLEYLMGINPPKEVLFGNLVEVQAQKRTISKKKKVHWRAYAPICEDYWMNAKKNLEEEYQTRDN